MSCLMPIAIVQKEHGRTISVPCGKCLRCRNRRASAWSFRLMQEEKCHFTAWFLTLTYSTSEVPITKNGFMSFPEKRARDIQLFLKRLRKAHAPGHKIKYYVCAEYGTKKKRPHYHMILFGAAVEKIQPAWGLGEIYYGTVTGASIGYTLKYMCKPSFKPQHKRDDRVPEFSLMSKFIGINYVTENTKRWHKDRLLERFYVNIEGGIKASMPRYYRDKIYTREQLSEVVGYQKGVQERRILKAYDTNADRFNRLVAGAVQRDMVIMSRTEQLRSSF